MQRSKPERASAVDVSASLEDVFASRSFGKPIPDALGMESASAMADVLGPRAAGIVKNRFIATVSVAAAALSLAVVAASTGTVKVPTLSAQNAGAPGQSNPDFSNPALGGSGAGQRQRRLGRHARAAAIVDADDLVARRRPGLDDARQRERHRGRLLAEQQQWNRVGGPERAGVQAPTTPTTAPPATTTTTTAPPVTTTTTTTTPPDRGRWQRQRHTGARGPAGAGAVGASCSNSQSNGHVVQTCP